MDMVILTMCGLLVAGLLAAALVSIWSTRPQCGWASPAISRRAAGDFVWAAIPWLMALATAIPAVIALTSGHVGD